MIELTDRYNGNKFYINAQMVERILPVMGGCEIILTTGKSVVCADDAKKLANRITMMHMSMYGNLNKHVNTLP